MRLSIAKTGIIRHTSIRSRVRGVLRFVCACSAMMFAVAGCASTPTSALDGNLPQDGQMQQRDAAAPQAAASYHVMVGEMAAQRGMTIVAAQQYVAALAYTDNEKLARRATRMALFAGQPALAYQAATEWAQLAPDTLAAQRTAARLALVSGDAQALVQYCQGVINAAQTPDDGYRLLSDILSGRPGRGQLAVQTLAGLVRSQSDSAVAWYSLGLVALRYGKVDMAEQAAQRASALDPALSQAVLLQAATLVRRHKPHRAQALVEALPGSAAERSDYHLQLARLLLDSRQLTPALAEFQRSLKLKAGNSAARYGVALVALNLNDLDRAQQALQRLYSNNRRPGRAAYYLGLINERRQDYATAEQWYRRVNAGSHVFDAGIRAAVMQARQGGINAARAELEQLRQQYPKMTERLYAAEGGMLFAAKRYEQALAMYNDALEQFPRSTDLLYGRSIVYEKLDRVDAALADLRQVVKLKPNDPQGLNALGYVLTNHTERYRHALELIQKALAADPGNAAILDSMGWVQYHLGQLDKALSYLQRAYNAFPDAEVAAHLGEVLWALGKHDQARQVWQQAQADNPHNALLEDTINRLTSNELQ